MGTVETKYNNYQFKQEKPLSFDIDYVRRKTCLHSFENAMVLQLLNHTILGGPILSLLSYWLENSYH